MPSFSATSETCVDLDENPPNFGGADILGVVVHGLDFDGSAQARKTLFDGNNAKYNVQTH